MRRKDREITDINQLEAILKKCMVCRLALHGDDYPYLVPVNFGYIRENDGFSLFFHGAKVGTKIDLLRKNPKATFEVDCEHQLIGGESPCAYTMEYESVIGHGVLLELSDREEKREGLLALMRQYAPGKAFTFSDEAIDSVAVLRLDVVDMTGKRLHK